MWLFSFPRGCMIFTKIENFSGSYVESKTPRMMSHNRLLPSRTSMNSFGVEQNINTMRAAARW